MDAASTWRALAVVGRHDAAMSHRARAWFGTIVFGTLGLFVVVVGIANWDEMLGRRSIPGWVCAAVGVVVVGYLVLTHRRRTRGHFDD